LFTTGNRKHGFGCQYAARRPSVPFELIDAAMARDIELGDVDVVGFATPTDFWGVPRGFEILIDRLPHQDGRPAFVFNTFGALSGKALQILAENVAVKGFNVLGGHSLQMPESYPPMLSGKMAAVNEPSAKALAGFDSFLGEVDRLVAALQDGRGVAGRAVRIGLLNSLFPRRSRTTARDDMGEKHVDALLHWRTCQTASPACDRAGTHAHPST
jgi:hypothetical protein